MNNKNTISRREFIKTSAAGVAGAALGAGGLLTAPGCEKDTPWYTIPRRAMNILGFMQYPSSIASYNRSSNSTHRGWVTSSCDRIKEVVVSDEPSDVVGGFTWEVDLFASNDVNAWCMPGARMAFYDGIMRMCDNPNGVAMVMGHEVAHAVRNHAGQRLGLQLGLTLGLQAIDMVANMTLGEVLDPAIIGVAMQVFSLGGQVGLLAYSRKHEYEADRLGMIYAAKAGYNPSEAPEFWRRMMTAFPSGGSDFLSTHPSNQNRINELNKVLPEADNIYQQGIAALPESTYIEERIAAMNAAMPEAMSYYKPAKRQEHFFMS